MNNIISLFTSDASISKSILTTDEAEDKIDENKPVSIFSIAKIHNIDPIFIVESSFVSFISSYKNAQKLNKQLIFGIKFKIVQDSKLKTEESFLTESSVIVWMKNSDGYKDLIKLYSAIHADESNFYYYPRGNWKLLQDFWTDNLSMSIPFYGGFISKNVLNYGHHAVPDFGSIRPNFILEEHELPFDGILTQKITNYCRENKYDIIEGHSIYYYKDKDVFPMQIMRCINNRSTFDCPNLNHFSSNKFSFESWRERVKNEQ